MKKIIIINILLFTINTLVFSFDINNNSGIQIYGYPAVSYSESELLPSEIYYNENMISRSIQTRSSDDWLFPDDENQKGVVPVSDGLVFLLIAGLIYILKILLGRRIKMAKK